MPSFMQRVDLNMVARNKKEIMETLREFRNIISEDQEIAEGRNEITRRGIERG
ncbi:MAG: hypothetical protein HY425_02300 [Candidatus Levybacteria bacterium]|nr:hypothetical protein [Candidatus Levybacteria bacterium]